MTAPDSGDHRVFRVGLADDQQLVRAGFGLVLDSQPDIEVAWQVANGKAAVEATAQNPVDVVFMDIQMPILDGISATCEIVRQQLRSPEGEPVRVVVLTTFDNDNYVLGSVESGASGFLLKDADPEELIGAVRTVGDSAAVISPAATARLMRQVRSMANSTDTPNTKYATQDRPTQNPSTQDLIALGQPAPVVDNAAKSEDGLKASADDDLGLVNPLTQREREILILMALGRSNQEISDELFISLPTVKTHVGRVLNKTESRDRVHAVLFAFRQGLVSETELLHDR